MSEKTFDVESADESSGFLLWQVTTLWERSIKKLLVEFEITHPQFVIMASLLWLLRSREDVMQIDLSSHSQIDPMTTSQILRTLETKQFLSRHAHYSDTRAKSIVFTEKGLKTIKQAVKAVEKFDQQFFSVLDEKQSNFNKLMVRLVKGNGSQE
jgi:MarR family transcriptional regulator, organic hydroperoxide resistance regulator